ncbi:MAG: FadR/GntR family transcriptional regulator [Pseudomonadota bacterium]
MAEDAAKSTDQSLPATIAAQLRESILSGDLASDERLPGEQELAERFGVSRPTIREALKRLAAQNLIRSRRGPTGGTFVNRMSWGEAHDSLATLSMLVIGMQGADPAEVIEARLALLKSCLPFAVKRRDETHIAKMRAEVDAQRSSETSDEDFCASDVRFHRALADAAGNPMLSFQMAGVVEGMQPLLNLITYQARDREVMAAGHEEIADALEARDAQAAAEALARMAAYVSGLATGLLTQRAKS